MNKLILLIKILLGIILLALLYVGCVIAYATMTDYKPAEKETVALRGKNQQTLPDDTLSFLTWNIGYCGLGKESDFFYDGGKTVVSPRQWVDKNLEGAKKILAGAGKADFMLLQEVDINSKRSYYQNQTEAIAQTLPDYNTAIAVNYDVKFVPKPFTSPMGKAHGGLLSLSPYLSTENTRHQYPSSFPWPTQLFFLDRCFLAQKYPLANGKQLVVINTHNSAYDNTGKLKKAEMDYLKNYLSNEYAKGNYVVVGGDWNQCPPNFNGNAFIKQGMEPYDPSNIAPDFMPEGWLWAYDPAVATNRSNLTAFNQKTTSTTLIDFFLISPNIELIKVQCIDLQFEYSDHQPVLMQVKFKK